MPSVGVACGCGAAFNHKGKHAARHGRVWLKKHRHSGMMVLSSEIGGPEGDEGHEPEEHARIGFRPNG